MLEIREVKSRKEMKQFLDFPIKLYENNPYFVPPLYIDEKKIFDKDYFYLDQAEAIYFNAYLYNKMVGRISGIIQYASNKKEGKNRVRFTRFDCINDQSVANALFKKIELWAKSKGMNEIVGPLGFSDLEREGLLIKGFTEISTYEEQYNFPYYQALIEKNGFIKEIDWVERKLFLPKEINPNIERLSKIMMERYKLKFADVKNSKEFIKKYGDKIFDLIDKTYVDIYGSVPFTPDMKQMLLNNFKLMIDIKYCAVIVDEKDNVVCFGICLPSISKVVQKSKGKLNITSIFGLLKAKKHPKVLDLGLIGVSPEYAKKGIASAFVWELIKILKKGEIKYFETNLNLENNLNIQNLWKSFDSNIHKRRRSFVKEIK